MPYSTTGTTGTSGTGGHVTPPGSSTVPSVGGIPALPGAGGVFSPYYNPYAAYPGVGVGAGVYNDPRYIQSQIQQAQGTAQQQQEAARAAGMQNRVTEMGLPVAEQADLQKLSNMALHAPTLEDWASARAARSSAMADAYGRAGLGMDYAMYSTPEMMAQMGPHAEASLALTMGQRAQALARIEAMKKMIQQQSAQAAPSQVSGRLNTDMGLQGGWSMPSSSLPGRALPPWFGHLSSLPTWQQESLLRGMTGDAGSAGPSPGAQQPQASALQGASSGSSGFRPPQPPPQRAGGYGDQYNSPPPQE